MQRWVCRKLRVPRVMHHHADLVAPLGDDRVTCAGYSASEHIETGAEIPNAGRGERANTLRQGVQSARHDAASPRMSFNTPAAVTAGPAPGPVMINGFV